MKITTSENIRDWYVRREEHTPEEVIEYVENMTRDEIKRLTIVYEDNLIAINGLPVNVPGIRDKEQSNYNGEIVWAYEYFKDRELVEVQYHSHPLDAPKKNDVISAEEFSEFIEEVIELWRVDLLKLLNTKEP